MKIVINKWFGGFSLSDTAADKLGLEWGGREIDRSNPQLVAIVEELGEEANGMFAHLGIVEIPDDVEWQIEEYDGSEWVAEKHRTWG